MALTRRDLLGGLAASFALADTNVAFAAAPSNKRFVFVVVRGGMDGLHAVAPYGDPDYRAARGPVALPGPGDAGGVLDLDGTFGLNPALAPLLPLWKDGHLGFVHAVAVPYRTRSHFDAQDVLENGTDAPMRADGWLNRAVGALDGPPDAVAFSGRLPLVLRGDAPAASLDPLAKLRAEDSLMDAIAALYADDAVLGPALAAGRAEQAKVDAELEAAGMADTKYRPGKDIDTQYAKVVGALLAAPDGPRIAVVETGGWDSHRNLAGLAGNLERLASAIVALRDALGPVWADTAVVLCSEFGRAVAGNGTGGTDHGTGGVLWLAGGAVAGGRVHGPWPGVSPKALLDGRDLAPATDVRAVLKGVLRGHLGLDDAALADVVFPGSAPVDPLPGLLRG